MLGANPQNTHLEKADQIQTEIMRKMRPEERLARAVEMNRTMRRLMDAGLRVQKPSWSEEQRKREIARRVLTARTS